MQTTEFLSTPITPQTAKGHTYSAKTSDLEKLGWDFTNDGYTVEEVTEAQDEYVLIEVTEEGDTFYTLNGTKHETGDDAQTIKNLDDLRTRGLLHLEA